MAVRKAPKPLQISSNDLSFAQDCWKVVSWMADRSVDPKLELTPDQARQLEHILTAVLRAYGPPEDTPS